MGGGVVVEGEGGGLVVLLVAVLRGSCVSVNDDQDKYE